MYSFILNFELGDFYHICWVVWVTGELLWGECQHLAPTSGDFGHRPLLVKKKWTLYLFMNSMILKLITKTDGKRSASWLKQSKSSSAENGWVSSELARVIIVQQLGQSLVKKLLVKSG